MGFAPDQVGQMSVWQFMAAFDGYVKANSKDDGGLSDSEVDELADWLGIG